MKKITQPLTIAVALSVAAFTLTPAAAQAPAGAAAASAKLAPSGSPRSFASPEEAVKSLIEAVRKADKKALVAVVGPGSEAWIFSGDAIQDEQSRQFFLLAFDNKNALEAQGDSRRVLVVGDDAWPFAIPLVNKGGRWMFDANAGREELANRRIGFNELRAIRTLVELVKAQHKFASADADGNRVPDYARRLIASEGKKDGLYWPASPTQAASPLEALAALAAAEGYKREASATPRPFHGYVFRILTAQGKDATGGARDYVVDGKLTGGFAFVASPVKYGVSGFKTFIVNQDGVVYEKNLGADGAAAAAKLSRYNPDSTWTKVKL